MIRKLKKGFTLVELVVVIAVVAILSAVAIVSFSTITKRANQSADRQVLDEMNGILDATEELKKPSTMYEALAEVSENGFSAQKMDTKTKTYEYAYSLKANRFVVLENEAVVYPENMKDTPKAEIWRFTESLSNLGEEYSYYLKGNTTLTGNYTIKTGLDVGDNKVEQLTFDRQSETTSKSVVIRTNGAESSLVVKGFVDSSDTTKGDIIYHYGTAGSLNVVKCATGSYHENGKVGFAEVSKGRIVLENSSNINHIHINKKDNSSFDEVIIKDNGAEALPEAITRDEVSVAEYSSTDVVTVVSQSGASETVKVYGSSAQGSTEKTSTQNTTISSDLGQLVLDNGSESKALNDDAKQEAKEESVDVIAGEEVATDPNASKYVARIGTKGYETFKEAVSAAQPGQTIKIIASSIVIDNDIGAYASYQYSGINNVVSFDADTSIYFQNNARVYMTNNAAFELNGNKLYVSFEASCDGSVDCGFMNCDICNMYSGLHQEYWDYKFEDGRARIMVDFHGNENTAPGFGLVYTNNQYVVGGMSSDNNCAYDEESANYVYINGVKQPGGGQWSKVVMIGDVARFYLGTETATYSWKIYGDGNHTKDVETSKYLKIEENHNNWVVVKGLVNEHGMNGSPAILEVTVTYSNSSTKTYEWWIDVRGGNSGTPGLPPSMDDIDWGF